MTKRVIGMVKLVKLLLAVVFFVPFSASGQYYYKDIVTTRQVNHTYLLYKTNKINQVTLNSYQGNRPVTEGFICEQKITKNQVTTYTKTADAGESFLTASYNAKALLIKTVDSSEETISTTLYDYDADDRILQISNETHAKDKSSKITEVHTWQYNAAGNPVQMRRIKNSYDTTIVSFKLDEQANVSEETLIKGGKPETIHYYYDARNRLTDIVRYNSKAKLLLPDYIFEYEENGELATMLVVPEGSIDYLKWYYRYDEMGLKAIDFCYNKRKELQGKIEYSYNSGNK